MTVASAAAAASQRHKIRRRRPDKPAITARLVLDDHIKSDVGILSQDLFTDLFPYLEDKTEDNPADNRCIAIAPWMPNTSCTDSAWCIVPVTRSSTLPHSTVHFSPSSPALQSFAITLQKIAPSKLASHSRSGIEILVLDVVAVPLETIFVSLESDLTKRLENGEGTFPKKGSSLPVARSALPEERLTTALRAALGTLKIVHAGDLFPLPLPPHPVTHLPPNPGRIVLCEPVAQGVLTPNTKVVLMRGRVHRRQERSTSSLSHLNGSTDNGGDTSADQFFSAAEERYKTDVPPDENETETATDSDTDLSETEQEDELSDDSMDGMISLEAPQLHATNINGPGTIGTGTPMTIGTLRGRKPSGIATPGSVFSNFTATTARVDRPRGRLFKAHGLQRPIPSEILHPKPTAQDDEEARIYVDMSSLPKIGCFSGDWVRIEVAEEPPSNGFGAFGLGSFGNYHDELVNWRPVRVFGLPEGYSAPRIVSRVAGSRSGERRLSFFESQVQRPASPAAYASPILLANLDNATHLRIAPLKKSSYPGKGTNPRFTSAAHPPYARDITIQHVRTPVSAERAYQTAVLAGLKHYFADKLRLVRTGDLIAVSVDSQLGRAIQETVGAGGSEVDDVMALTTTDQSENECHYDGVAWFKVGHIEAQKTDEDEDRSTEMFWGSIACVDSSTVAMHGSGFVTSRIPGTSNSTWPYYLGLRKTPKQSTDASTSPTLTIPVNDDIPPLRRQLRELLMAATSPRATHLKMPPVAILLTSTHRNIGKTTMATRSCADVGLHTYEIDAYGILNETGGSGSDVKTEGFLRSRAERAQSCGSDYCALLIRHIEALTADRIEATMKDILADMRVLIATTNNVDDVSDGVRALFTHELEMGAPDEAEREAILRGIIADRGVTLDTSIDLNSVALKTAALVAGDLIDVVERACLAQRTRLETLSSKNGTALGSSTGSLPLTVRDLQVAGGPLARSLTSGDFDMAVEAARKNFSDSIGAPKIPNVTWDDVGGLGNVKDAITETIQLPLERPELFAKGMKKRSGILFYGPPGTGKTLLAKAIATEYSLNFFSVKGPELLNMYIGESEANVRRVFQRARDARPCVVFFDELDSVAPKRGNQGDSGGVMDRIVSQLLAELDGMSGGDDTGGVFVIGATNRPDLLDQALLRPGRFDKMLYLGVSDTHEKQRTILEALTRKFTLHPSVSLASVAQRLPFTYTGADFYALCSDAMLKAVTRQAAAVDAKVAALNAERPKKRQEDGQDQRSTPAISTAYFFDHLATREDVAVTVTERDFADAQAELIPSVSAGELAHYENVRAAFEGGRDARSRRAGGGAGGGGRSPSKGKGKATTIAEEVANGTGTGDIGRVGRGKGKGRDGDKGKGKAVAGGFRDGTASDDDDLY